MRTDSRRDSALLTVAAVAFAALVLWNSVHKSMWTDESYSLNTAMRPVAGTIHQALRFELQPPLYFVALNGWLRLHAGIIFARLLSLACALGTLSVLAAIGRLVGMRGWRSRAPALLALATPGVIWAADEARVYALTLLLASSTLYWYLRLLTDPERPGRSATIYAFFAYLSVLTFYYTGFLLLGQWIGTLIIRRQVPRITAALAAVTVGLLPLVPTILTQRATHPIDVPLADPGHPLYTIAITPIKALLTDTQALYLPHALLIIWAILVLVPVVRYVWGDKAGVDEMALIPAVAVPLVAIGALMYFHLVPVRHRHFVLLLPATLTLVSIWIARTRAGVPRTLSGAAVALLLLAFVVSFEVDPQYPEDWRQVAGYLEQHMTPSERILVFDPDRVLALQYYLGPHASASGLPVDPDLEHYAPSEYAIRDTAAIAQRLAALGATGGVWLVEAQRLMPTLQSSVGVIETFVHRHYVVGTPVQFRGVHVTHLQPSYAR
jgi:mannosyltransferase